MDRVWRNAPVGALHVWQDAQGVHAEPNEVATRWAGRQGLVPGDWQPAMALLSSARGAEPVEVAVGVQRHSLSCRPVPLADGSLLLWLDLPLDDERLAAVRRATEFLERALVLAGVSVWRLDLRTQRLHFNAVGFQVSGMHEDPAGIPVEAIRETIHPDDHEAVVRAAEQAIASDSIVDVVARYRNSDGGWRTLLTRRVADRDEHGAVVGLAGISLDLSPQRVERERAEALAEQTRLAAEAIGVGFWSRDLDAGTAYWDEQMYRIHRRDPREGPPSYEEWIDLYVHPQDRQAVHAIRRHAALTWEPFGDALFRARDTGEGERWVHVWTRRMIRDGHRLTFGMHMDVTERQREQMLLQRERARTQFAAEAAEVGIWERSIDGAIIYWNETMYRLRGLDPADPRTIEELAAATSHPDDHAEMERMARQHLADGTPYRYELRVRRPGGGWRWLVTQGRGLRDQNGRLLGMAGVNLDITERKETDVLRQQKAQAEQANRDKSEFLARVSHELRTPMNAVLGFTQLLDDDPTEPPTQRQRVRLQRIAAAGSQMMALVDDLLDLSSLDAGVPVAAAEPMPVADAVRQVLDTLAGLAQLHGVALRAGRLADGASVRADRRRLTQLLTHLATHALRRQPRGGWVELAAQVEAGLQRPQMVFVVRDGGPGYSETERATFFEPFVRHGSAARTGAGTGIGLSLALRLAQALGGRLEIDTRQGAGNELRLHLPAEEGGPTPPQLPLTTVPTLPLCVLCVEDNPVNLLLVRELLALRPGVTLHSATDGRSGIECALAVRPDVVLLDLQLPDIGGHEVLVRLRSDPAMGGCVFVALSANAMPDHIAAARAAGFDDYWTKPIDFERFLAGIDRLAYGANRSRIQAPPTSR
jgi:PAS domain S-box-containing protein